jgi:hypothetical protein
MADHEKGPDGDGLVEAYSYGEKSENFNEAADLYGDIEAAEKYGYVKRG